LIKHALIKAKFCAEVFLKKKKKSRRAGVQLMLHEHMLSDREDLGSIPTTTNRKTPTK
jgi:hypothetical protein